MVKYSEHLRILAKRVFFFFLYAGTIKAYLEIASQQQIIKPNRDVFAGDAEFIGWCSVGISEVSLKHVADRENSALLLL